MEKITPYDIFKFYLPKISLGKKINSPMPGRKDDTPSFVISQKYGNIYYTDYGDSRYYGDCIKFVMQLFNLSFSGALVQIDKDFGLGILSPAKDYKSIISSYSQPTLSDSGEVSIECTYKKFTKEAHDWWNAYHLSEDYLKNRNTLQVKQLFIGRQKFPIPYGEIVFTYITEDGKKKIYRPTVPRSVKKEDQWKLWRFRSNIPFDYMFMDINPKNCKKILVLKSRKDELVSSLITDCVSSVQAESIACFSDKNLKLLKDKEVFLGFGTDEQGKRESKLITSTFGWKHYNTENKYLPLNDIAEVAKGYGLEVVEKHFKLKGII